MLATAFIFNGNCLFSSLHYYMSDKNSKITDALGLLTTIFLFFTVSLGFFSPYYLAFFHRITWLFFTASLGFFSPYRLAFFHRIAWLFFTASFGFF